MDQYWYDTELTRMMELALQHQWKRLVWLVEQGAGLDISPEPLASPSVRAEMDDFALMLSRGDASRDPRFAVMLDQCLRLTQLGYLTEFPQYHLNQLPMELRHWQDRRDPEIVQALLAMRCVQPLVLYRRFYEIPRQRQIRAGQPDLTEDLADKTRALSAQTGLDVSDACDDPHKMSEIMMELADELDAWGLDTSDLTAAQLDALVDATERDARHLMRLSCLRGRLPAPFLRAEHRARMANWTKPAEARHAR
ncbi:MAG: hypothetical protein Alpg2KO_13970 [Alphaproteobacteria bacterium]